MKKKHFIALADMIIEHNRIARKTHDFASFHDDHLLVLADFCKRENYNFNRDRWLDYIAGKCGPNGGKK